MFFYHLLKFYKTVLYSELGTGRETLVRSNTTIVPTLPQRDQVLRAALMSPGIEYYMFNGRTNTL